MEEELELILSASEDSMEVSIKHLEKSLNNIRAGRANPLMLQGIKVDYYGAMTSLGQVSNITAPDGTTLLVQPWERQLLSAIEKAIFQANIGLTPTNNGEVIIINIPPLTEERRKDLAKQVKGEAEISKVSIRKFRQEANNDLKKIDKLGEDLKADFEEKIQQLTDKYINRVDHIVAKKEKEIMAI